MASNGAEQARTFKVGETVLVPCVVESVDADDDLYPVKVQFPHGVKSGTGTWLHVDMLPTIRRES